MYAFEPDHFTLHTRARASFENFRWDQEYIGSNKLANEVSGINKSISIYTHICASFEKFRWVQDNISPFKIEWSERSERNDAHKVILLLKGSNSRITLVLGGK